MEQRILSVIQYRMPNNSIFEETNILLIDLLNKINEKLE